MQGIGQGVTGLPLTSASTTASPLSEAQALRRQSRFRMAVGWFMIALWTISSWSLDWDADWHSRVGRDGFWTPPHLVFYSTIAATGLICAGVVLLETWLYRRRYPGYNDQTTTPVLFFFRGPVGFALAGFGMLVMLISAPLDDYWHRIYGIDVKVWAPFHVMLLLGIIMANIGLVYVFASEISRRRQGQAVASGLLAEIRSLFEPATLGLILAMMFLITRFLFLMGETTGLERGNLTLGGLVLPAYSLVVVMLPVALVALAGATGRVGAATLAGLVLLIFRLIDAPLIQWGVDYLVKDQGRSLREGSAREVVWVWIYPLFLPLVGLAIDLIFYLTRSWREAGPGRRQLLVAGGAGLVGGLFLFLLERPWEHVNDILRSFAGSDRVAQAQIESRLFHPDYWAALPLAVVIAVGAGLIGWAWAVSLRYTER